jgi:hypothetical protein
MKNGSSWLVNGDDRGLVLKSGTDWQGGSDGCLVSHRGRERLFAVLIESALSVVSRRASDKLYVRDLDEDALNSSISKLIEVSKC